MLYKMLQIQTTNNLLDEPKKSVSGDHSLCIWCSIRIHTKLVVVVIFTTCILPNWHNCSVYASRQKKIIFFGFVFGVCVFWFMWTWLNTCKPLICCCWIRDLVNRSITTTHNQIQYTFRQSSFYDININAPSCGCMYIFLHFLCIRFCLFLCGTIKTNTAQERANDNNNHHIQWREPNWLHRFHSYNIHDFINLSLFFRP